MFVIEIAIPIKDNRDQLLTINKGYKLDQRFTAGDYEGHIIYSDDSASLTRVADTLKTVGLPFDKFEGGITVLSNDTSKLLSSIVGAGIVSRTDALAETKHLRGIQLQ